MAVKHKTIPAGTDKPGFAGVTPSLYAEEHAFSGGALGSVLIRNATNTDGSAWVDTANGVLTSTGAGVVPTFATTLPNAVQDNITRTGIVASGTWAGLSQTITPATTNTYDLGTVSVLYRTGYFRTSLILGQTSGNYTLTWANPASARAISIADPGGTDVFTFNAASQTLTNKTLTAPVLGGSVTGTYTLAGTPTIASPVLSGSVTGTYTLAGTPTITGPTISNPVLSGTATGTYTLGGTPTITSPTISNPVFSGTATGTYTLGGTPTITSPTINSAALSGTLSGTPTFSGIFTNGAFGSHSFSAGGTGNNLLTIQNTSAGVTNEAIVVIANNLNNSLRLDMFSSTWTPSGDSFADGARITTGGAGGLSISTAQAIRYYTAGVFRWGINAAGDATFGASSHIADSVGTPSLGVGFGTSPTITGTDYAFAIKTGATGTPTGGTVTFGHAFNTAPVPTISWDNVIGGGITPVITLLTASSMQIIPTSAGNLANAGTIYIHLRGF